MKHLIIILAFTTLQAREINLKYLQWGFDKYGSKIKLESYKNGIDYKIVIALICYENHTWNVRAKSKTGDLGLMQIHSKDTIFYNPKINLEYGIRKLAKLIHKYGLVKGLTSYNRGIKGMKRVKTPLYTKEIIRFYKQIKEMECLHLTK